MSSINYGANLNMSCYVMPLLLVSQHSLIPGGFCEFNSDTLDKCINAVKPLDIPVLQLQWVGLGKPLTVWRKRQQNRLHSTLLFQVFFFKANLIWVCEHEH